jgi:clan AA aspartic protease
MGYVKVNVRLRNSGDIAVAKRGFMPVEQVRAAEVPILVDTGAINICLNEETVELLGLPLLHMGEAHLADNTTRQVPIVGPVDIEYGDRSTTQRAIVLPRGAENLLGVIPLEDMDLSPVPSEGKLVHNSPENTTFKILSPRY